MYWFPKYNFILASKSPRRQQLLSQLGIEYTVKVNEAPETFPDGLAAREIPVFIARQKALAVSENMGENNMIIAADTIVWVDNQVIGKPKNAGEAKKMLQTLSGNIHQVITGVCLKTIVREKTFCTITDVEFKELQEREIDYYIEKYKPLDKAGAYGIQEWIGQAGIVSVRGSYFNVMGLPIQRLYEEIQNFENGENGEKIR